MPIIPEGQTMMRVELFADQEMVQFQVRKQFDINPQEMLVPFALIEQLYLSVLTHNLAKKGLLAPMNPSGDPASNGTSSPGSPSSPSPLHSSNRKH